MTRSVEALPRATWRGIWWRALAAAIGATLLATAAAAPAWSAPAERSEDYTFAFQNADISAVAQEIFGQLGIRYVLDPGVTGKISFRIDQRMTKAQVLVAFEAALGANGVALVRDGDQMVVTPQAKAKSTAGVRTSREGAGGAGYEVVAVPLSYVQPTEAAKALEAISGADTVLYSNDKLGLLLLGGSGPSLKAALETLKVFDQSTFVDSKIRWFELHEASAPTVAGELDRVVQGAGLAGVSVVPLKRLNGLIVFARSANALEEIAAWVKRLDTTSKEQTSTLWVYHPRNTSAEALARTLNSVLGGQVSTEQNSTAYSGATPTAAPALASATPATASLTTQTSGLGTGEDQVRVGVDKETNTLIVFAQSPRWLQIQRILDEIDRTPAQILIEASILEVTLSKDFEFGVDWSVLSDKVGVSSIYNDSGKVGASYPGFNVTFLSNDIQAAVRALGSRTGVEVVSAPKIIALDNHTARLQVGDQVPVIVQNARSTTTPDSSLVSTVDYRNTGVILSVAPRVAGDDQVVLDVTQEVSAVAKTVTSGIDSPTIQQRRFESTLVLHNGGVVALGGLISTNRTVSKTGVPGVREVPMLGALFSSSSKNQRRTELIILLKATIIRDQATTSRVMTDLMADMQELRTRGLLPHQP
jgi:general secretion pathway protein D